MFSNIVILLFTVSMASYQATACPVITAPANGASTCTSGTSAKDETCTITCSSGYSLTAGTKDLTCLDSADSGLEWSDATTPVCTATACPEISAPANGASTCTSGTSAKDATCTISCASGYSLTAGTESLTCHDSTDSAGKWSDTTTPVCTATACPVIIAPANGASTCTTGTSAKGETCAITCSSGYSLTAGTKDLTCQDSTNSAGEWSDATTPVCTAITCATLTVSDATVTCSDTNKYDSSCTVECNAGKSLSAGTSPVTCGDATSASATGVWSNTAHACTATACVAILAPTNGASTCTSGTSAKDATCTISCVSGYSLTAGTASLTCQDSTDSVGEWSDATAPVCSATACAQIPAPTNGASTCTSGTSAKGASCTISCNSGYSLTAGTESLTCQDSTDSAGKWSDATTPVCTATACPEIPAPTNGSSTCTSGTSAKGETCTITCSSGYSLTAGTKDLTCQDSTNSAGEWSDATAPVCTALITVSASPATYFLGDDVTISAVILDAVPDGDYTISYGETTVSKVTIASGNDLSVQASTPGVTNVTVEVSGTTTIKVKKTWLVEADDGKVVKFDHASGNDNDKSFTLDISTSCIKIPNPANGTSTCATTVTQVGSSCTITCNEGTTLSGSSPVKCETGSGLTGKWSNTTDKYTCDAVSGAGMIALNMMLALILGTISSFMM